MEKGSPFERTVRVFDREQQQSVDPILQKPIYNDLSTALDICGFWPTLMPDAVENQPATSDIPALVLAGEYDPVIPP
jgi:hypothetical protein